MAIALTVIVGLVLLILIHELGHFLAAKIFGVRVDEFGIGFPPRIWGKQVGETYYSLNWIPFGGFVRIFGESPLENVSDSSDQSRSFLAQPAWKRAVMLSAGVVMNVFAGWLIFSGIFLVGTPKVVVIHSVAPNSPAALSGFEPGDTILGFSSVQSLTDFINDHRGEVVSLRLRRNSEELSLSSTPRISPPADEGALGVSLIESGVESVPFGLNFWEAAKYTFAALLAIIFGIINIFQELLVGVTPQVAGPVGIFGLANQVGQEGLVFVLHLVGMISLNLVILNLLPFPALDGGRLLFLLLEKITRRSLPVKFEAYANAFGMLVLLIVMVLVTANDIRVFF